MHTGVTRLRTRAAKTMNGQTSKHRLTKAQTPQRKKPTGVSGWTAGASAGRACGTSRRRAGLSLVVCEVSRTCSVSSEAES